MTFCKYSKKMTYRQIFIQSQFDTFPHLALCICGLWTSLNLMVYLLNIPYIMFHKLRAVGINIHCSANNFWIENVEEAYFILHQKHC